MPNAKYGSKKVTHMLKFPHTHNANQANFKITLSAHLSSDFNEIKTNKKKKSRSLFALILSNVVTPLVLKIWRVEHNHSFYRNVCIDLNGKSMR